MLLATNDLQHRLTARSVVLLFRATPERRRLDREHTGDVLDQVDRWIADGVLNGPELHCADYAVASSLALVDYIRALRPELQRRPLYGLVERVLPLSAAGA